MPNAYPNKIQVMRGGQTETLIDLTADTAVASDVAQGKYFHLASGERVVGTATGGGGGGAVYQDQDGFIVLSDQGGGSSVTVEALSVTQNGTYTAPTGKAYSPVTVNVSGGASNIVQGTFEFDSTYSGTAQDVSLAYSGSGYPIAMVIAPSEGGHNASGECYQTLWRYGITVWSMVKSCITGDYAVPTYAGASSYDWGTTAYKYKNSTSSSYATTNGGGTSNAVYNNTDATATGALAVQLKSASSMSVFMSSTSYGFIPGIEYSYTVIYSS